MNRSNTTFSCEWNGPGSFSGPCTLLRCSQVCWKWETFPLLRSYLLHSQPFKSGLNSLKVQNSKGTILSWESCSQGRSGWEEEAKLSPSRFGKIISNSDLRSCKRPASFWNQESIWWETNNFFQCDHNLYSEYIFFLLSVLHRESLIRQSSNCLSQQLHNWWMTL